MTQRFGVFGTADGWLLARPDGREFYPTQEEAIATALRLAHLTRWRGGEAEVLTQDRLGDLLSVIDPPARATLELRR